MASITVLENRNIFRRAAFGVALAVTIALGSAWAISEERASQQKLEQVNLLLVFDWASSLPAIWNVL